MGKLDINMPDDLMNQLNRCEKIVDDIAPKMLKKAITPLTNKIKANTQKHKVTGSLLNSIAEGKASKDKSGTWKIRVIFDGYDTSRISEKNPKGIANHIKAMALEYGTSDQQATPMIRPAVISTESEVVNILQKEFTSEVEKI